MSEATGGVQCWATEGGGMRSVSDGDKLQGNSLPEIRDAWQQATLDLGREPEIREAGRGALRAGNLLNAALLWFLSRPEEERKQIAAWGLRALERLKEYDKPVDLRRKARDDFAALGGPGGADEEVVTPKRGSRSPGRDARRTKRTG